MNSVEDIVAIKRPIQQPDPDTAAIDLLWSDPHPSLKGYSKNTVRGVSVFFGADALALFCEKLKLEMVVRAHQVMPNGYSVFANRKLVTIFTAPRYQADQNNSGAVMSVNTKGKMGFVVLKPNDRTDSKNSEGSAASPASPASPSEKRFAKKDEKNRLFFSSSGFFGMESKGTEMRLAKEKKKKKKEAET